MIPVELRVALGPGQGPVAVVDQRTLSVEHAGDRHAQDPGRRDQRAGGDRVVATEARQP